jgi:hypothetical protein
VLITGVRVNGTLLPVIDAAVRAINRASNRRRPIVFAPPICVLKDAYRARNEDLANGLVLSVEIDEGDTAEKRQRLESIIGVRLSFILVANGLIPKQVRFTRNVIFIGG